MRTACDYVLQFNFKIAHIAGSVKSAADFLSGIKLKVAEKIHLKIRGNVQTTPTEMTTSSSDVPDEEQFFFMKADGQHKTEEQILQREKAILEEGSRMGSKSATILIEAKYPGVHRSRRKHYAVIYQWNQSKCTNTSREKRRYSTQESET